MTVFSDQTVSDYYNATFINFSLNFEEGEGLEFAKQYEINAYPTYMYFDKEGKLLHISGSGKPAGDFIQDGKNAFDPDKAYSTLKDRYDKGDRASELLYSFTEALIYSNISGNLLDSVASEYLQVQSAQTPESEKSLLLVYKIISHDPLALETPVAQYYFKHLQSLIRLIGEKEISKTSLGIIDFAATHAGMKKDTSEMNRIQSLIKNTGQKNKEQFKAFAEIKYRLAVFIQGKKEWKSYANAVLSYSRRYALQDNFTLREAATYLYYYTNQPEALQAAMQIIDRAILAKNSYDNVLVQAKLFHKQGDSKKALIAANNAIKLALIKSENTDEAKELISQIEKK